MRQRYPWWMPVTKQQKVNLEKVTLDAHTTWYTVWCIDDDEVCDWMFSLPTEYWRFSAFSRVDPIPSSYYRFDLAEEVYQWAVLRWSK